MKLSSDPEYIAWLESQRTLNRQSNPGGRPEVKLTYKGRTLSIYQWSIVTGLSEEVIRKRRSRGWTVDRILTK